MQQQLSKLYMDLATNADVRRQFLAGQSADEIRVNRSKLMAEYGITDADQLLEMSQNDVEEAIANELRAGHAEWSSLNKMNSNRVNSDNRISELGL